MHVGVGEWQRQNEEGLQECQSVWLHHLLLSLGSLGYVVPYVSQHKNEVPGVSWLYGLAWEILGATDPRLPDRASIGT